MTEDNPILRNKQGVLSYISMISTIIISGTLLLFPLLFLTTTTDFYIFPKQILIVFAALALFLLWGIKGVIEKKVTFILNPLNLPIFIFGLAIALSTILSPNTFDSIIQSVPIVMSVLIFFMIVNFLQDKTAYSIALSSLLIGGVISAIITIFYQLEIFILPFPEIQNQLFNTLGSSIQQFAFLTPLLVFTSVSIIHELRSKKISTVLKSYNHLLQIAASLIFLSAIGTIFYQIVTATQKPIILPMSHGFQIALSSLSQDASRLVASFLLGSGYGTFSTAFTAFHLPTLNALPTWNITFAFSSSYFLELISTVGILGTIAFIFVIFKFVKARHNVFHPIFVAIAITFILAFVIPFTFPMVFLLIVLLAFFTSHLHLSGSNKIQRVILNVVALKQGLLSIKEDEHLRRHGTGMILPISVLTVSLLTAFVVSFSLVQQGESPRRGFVNLFLADTVFANSLQAESLREGSQTYQNQLKAINTYPYRSDYYRIFSQVNVALASSLVSSQAGEATVDPQVQQNILQLLQQAINSGRTAVTISPRNSINWSNLAQIYRSLIGVGENAEQFAIASMNQAIVLNPNNPALRIDLGGIYFQLQQYDLAQNSFQIAVNLKPDFANARYNLGHAFEERGDLINALREYQIVQQLIANDQDNLDQITSEIEALQARIGQAAEAAGDGVEPSEDTNLELNTQVKEFPPLDPLVEIPEPPSEEGEAPQEEEPTPTPTQ